MGELKYCKQCEIRRVKVEGFKYCNLCIDELDASDGKDVWDGWDDE